MGFKVLLRSLPGEFHSALKEVFEESSLELICPDDLDWSDAPALKAYCQQVLPCAVVNYSPGSSCFSEEEQALNSLSQVCSDCTIPIIHFSSYRVFDGELEEGELDEYSIPDSQDEYGKHLQSLEKLCAAASQHLILRLSWVLGGEQENTLDHFVPQVMKGQQAIVSDHDFARPVSVGSLANIVHAVIRQLLCGAQNWGVFHIRSSDKCSEAEFSDVLVRILQSDFSYLAELPSVSEIGDNGRLLSGNAMLGGDRLTRNFGVQCVSWRKGLKALVQNYIERNPARLGANTE